MKQLPTAVLKGCSYVGTSLYRLCVPSAIDERVGFDVRANHIFLQCEWATITLVGVELEMEGLELEPGVKWDFPSAQWPSLPYLEGVLIDHNYKFPLRQSHSEKVSAQFDMAGSVFKENKCDDTGERKGTGQWRVNGRATETVRAWVKVRQPEQGTKEVTELETVTPWRGKGSQLDTSEDEERSGYL